MIVVVGEALVDLVVGIDGSVSAALGGAPYNAARAAARLGATVSFAGALSTDRFGSRLADRLHADGVSTVHATRTDLPTTLAVAETDPSGSATYRFYIDGTSAPSLDAAVLDATAGPDVFFTGGLALVLEPMASIVAGQVDRLPEGTMSVVDVNARPAVISDRTAYLERLRKVCRRADVVKVSDEDLDVLAPELSIEDLMAIGVGAVLVTAGPSGTEVVHRSGRRAVPVAVLPAPIVDTIGAGDTFIGGFMAAWIAAGRGRADVRSADAVDALGDAVDVAHAAAALVVTRHGADPPLLTDLPERFHPRLRREM